MRLTRPHSETKSLCRSSLALMQTSCHPKACTARVRLRFPSLPDIVHEFSGMIILDLWDTNKHEVFSGTTDCA